MIVYITILAILVGVLSTSLNAILVSYKHIKISRTIETSALTSLERITREIKNGESINSAQSVFGTASSSITIDGKDTLEAAKTSYIYLQNGVIKIRENGIEKGQLTASTTNVTNFTLRLIDQADSDAVKIEMTIQAGTGDFVKNENFYSTAVLRGSY